MRKVLTLIAAIALYSSVGAQPSTDLHQYGCHFTKHHLHKSLTPISPEMEAAIAASNSRSDTFDILNYNIKVDITSYTSKKLKGECTVLFTPKLENIPSITLDLRGLQVDSIKWADGSNLAFTHQDINLTITLPAPLNLGETGAITVWYQGTPIQSPSGFGGVYFESNYIYSLSIGLTDTPHNFGHAWFPCFDNFVERSAFELSFLTTLPFRAYASGDFVTETPADSATVWRTYRMDIPACTYHVSFAAAQYGELKQPHIGSDGTLYPIELLAKYGDTTKTKNACFNYLHEALDCFEYWFGPFPYNRVGYAMATRGAMENPGNTIYPDFLILPENFAQHLNILSHELAHQWWGNVVTVGSAADMWVKEGNAEYGAHLFHEYFYSKESAIELEKRNNYDMLLNAHYDDGAFLALSPMPKSITYGSTTYNKGALTIHNLRQYLGDSLFRTGMTHLQTALRYEAMDAYEMRDSLSAATGVNLTDFFNDWVFQPGWADYALDSMTIQPLANGQYDVRVHVRQGLRAATHFHHNTPLDVDFRKPDGTFETKQLLVAGEKGIGSFQLNYAPIYCAVNRNHSLNLGQVTYEKAITAPGTFGAPNTLLSINVKNVPANDSAWVWVAHHWSAPDQTPALPSTVRISGRHYWTVEGNWPAGYVANGIFRFDNGIQNAELDADVAPSGVHEDSLLLLYRPGAGHEWVRFPRVKLFTVGSSVDGFGLLRADTMLAGEYAIASGYMDISVASSEPISKVLELQVSPNPVQDQLLVQWETVGMPESVLELVDLNGKLIQREIHPTGNVRWSMNNLPSGTYLVRLLAADQTLLGANKVVKY